MSYVERLLVFYGAVLVVQLSPGPDMLLVVGQSLASGRRHAVLAAAGATLGAGLIQVPLLALGVASLLSASPLALNLLRGLGALYLALLGVRLLRSSLPASSIRGDAGARTPWGAVRDGFVSNLTNPKPTLFMVSFLPQFVQPDHAWSMPAQLAFLGTLQKLSGFVVLSSIGIGAGSARHWLRGRGGFGWWQSRLAGVMMLTLAGFLAWGALA